MMRPEGSAPPAPARGRFTFVPCWVSAVLVTMKMISRTRKMSVSGVTLISATMSSPPSSPASTRLSDTTDTSFPRPPRRQFDQQLVSPLAPHGGEVADAYHERVVGEDR